MSILFEKVRIKSNHPHYGDVTGTISSPAVGGRWYVSMLDGEKRYALGLRITACAVMTSDEFEVIA